MYVWRGTGAIGLIVCIGAGCRRGDLEPAVPRDTSGPAVTTPTDPTPPPDAVGSGAADCSGAAAEAPLTLATVSDHANVRGLFVDDGAVYFGAATDGDPARVDPSHGVLCRVPKDGGAVEELWSGPGWPYGIGTTDRAIFLMTYDYRSRGGQVRMRARRQRVRYRGIVAIDGDVRQPHGRGRRRVLDGHHRQRRLRDAHDR